MMISPQSIQEVLSRADIIDIVGQFVRLKKRGANYMANCPFHNEKTPSFHVSAAKGIYKCFGCGKGGNVVTFIQEHEKLSYPESIRWLADYYKITLEESERTPEQQQHQLAEEGLRILNEYAAQYFHENLLNTEEGQNIGLSYFKQRGFRKEIIERFRLGYNSESGDTFYKSAAAKGHNPEMLERAGLVKNRNDRFYDVYRGRVIFPIQSMTGRILGFGARILKSNEKAPKYINTPENELYVKSRVLYGMYQSRQAIGKLDECFLVEGYTDVISLHQGGVENVVSSSGTSLTEDQLRLIAQLTKNLTILYDGDSAGIKAALRGLDMALGQSFNVQLVLLPEGEDPDSYIQSSGAAKFHEYVKENKKDVIGFRLEVGLAEAGKDPVKRSKLVNEIAESISRINKAEDFALQSHYIREAARKLDVEEAGLVTLINKYIRDRVDKENKHYSRDRDVSTPLPDLPPQEERETAAQKTNDEEQEWQLIRILLEYGDRPFEEFTDTAARIYESIDPEVLESEAAREIFKQYFSFAPIRPAASYFTNYPDATVQQRVATLLHTRNDISHNWKEKYAIEPAHGELNYINDVESTIAYFELKQIILVQEQFTTLLMKEQDPNKQSAFQKKFMELRMTEREIIKKHGTVVFKLLRK